MRSNSHRGTPPWVPPTNIVGPPPGSPPRTVSVLDRIRLIALFIALFIAAGVIPGSPLVYVTFDETTIEPAPLDVPDAERPGLATVRVLDLGGAPIAVRLRRLMGRGLPRPEALRRLAALAPAERELARRAAGSRRTIRVDLGGPPSDLRPLAVRLAGWRG